MKRMLFIILVITLCLLAFSGCSEADCEHNWERTSNYNEHTAVDKCSKCEETRMYTDPDSILTGNTEEFVFSGVMSVSPVAHATVCLDYSSELILDLLNNGEWENDVTDCDHDYVISLNGKSIRYHSECGTFINITDGKSLPLGDSDRSAVNELLEGLFEHMNDAWE